MEVKEIFIFNICLIIYFVNLDLIGFLLAKLNPNIHISYLNLCYNFITSAKTKTK